MLRQGVPRSGAIGVTTVGLFNIDNLAQADPAEAGGENGDDFVSAETAREFVFNSIPAVKKPVSGLVADTQAAKAIFKPKNLFGGGSIPDSNVLEVQALNGTSLAGNNLSGKARNNFPTQYFTLVQVLSTNGVLGWSTSQVESDGSLTCRAQASERPTLQRFDDVKIHKVWKPGMTSYQDRQIVIGCIDKCVCDIGQTPTADIVIGALGEGMAARWPPSPQSLLLCQIEKKRGTIRRHQSHRKSHLTSHGAPIQNNAAFVG